MTVLARSVNRDQLHGSNWLGPLPVATGVILYHNQAVGFDANHCVTPATTAIAAIGVVDLQKYDDTVEPGGGAFVVGRTTGDEIDNTNGADGDRQVVVRRGTFKFAQKTGDEIDIFGVGDAAYVADDNSVQATGGGAVMGKSIQLAEDGGVYVEIPSGQYGQF